MTVSSLARDTITTNKCNTRTQRVQKFTPHYMVAAWSGEQCARYFRDCDRQVSANYCIGIDGGIVCNVPEQYRAWTSSSSWNDQRAITVECANLAGGVLTEATWNSLVKLGADVMRRYGFRPWYTGDRDGTLTEHMMFTETDCPGPWLHPRMGDLAVAIKNELDGNVPKPDPEYDVPKVLPGEDIAGMKTGIGIELHRLYNPANGDHLYTTDANEVRALVKSGFVDEGQLGEGPSGICLLYRLYNFDSGQHLLTADYNEATKLIEATKDTNKVKRGWHFEGVPTIAYVGGKGEVPVHRLLDPNTGNHLLTVGENERNVLTSKGWKDEGVAFSLDRR